MSVSIEKLEATKTRGIRYRARYRGYYRGDDLKLHQMERTKTFERKNDAEAWLLEKQQEKAQGVDKQVTKITWIFDHFYALSKEPYLRENTKRSWNFARKIFVNYFGEDRTVDSITSDDYQAFMNWGNTRYSHTTLLGVSQKMAEVFKYAVEHRYINRSPILSSLRIAGNKARTVQYLNLEQIKLLLDYIHTHHMKRRSGVAQEAGTWKSIAFAVYTGCRLGEIAGLTWDHIDLETGEVKIDRQLDTRSGLIGRDFIPLKTPHSYRTVTIPQHFVKDLLELKAPGDEFVFLTASSQPLQSSVTSNALHTLLGNLGVSAPGFHFHSLRHSHVALLLANDVDIYAISRRLGHANLSVTLNTYAYLIDEKKDREDKKIMKVLDDLP